MVGHGSHMAHTAHRVNGARADRSLLAVNSGSSSIKFGLFTFAPEPLPLRRGTANASSRGTAVSELMQHIAREISITRWPLWAIESCTAARASSSRSVSRRRSSHHCGSWCDSRRTTCPTNSTLIESSSGCTRNAAGRLFRHRVPCRSSGRRAAPAGACIRCRRECGDTAFMAVVHVPARGAAATAGTGGGGGRWCWRTWETVRAWPPS